MEDSTEPKAPRPRYPSDDEHNDRRRKGLLRPGSFMVLPHSMTNAPRTVGIYTDNDLLAALVRLDMTASKQGAIHKADRVILSRAEVLSVMGAADIRTAVTRLETIGRHLGAPLEWACKPTGAGLERDWKSTGMGLEWAWSINVSALERPWSHCRIHLPKFARIQGLTPRKWRNETADSAAPASASASASASSEEEIAATPLVETASPSRPEAPPDASLAESETATKQAPEVTAAEIVDAWRRICVPRGAPDVRELTGSRLVKLRVRIREHPTYDWWNELFNTMSRTPFLFGNGTRGWRASIDWLLANDTNATKILEGRYHD